MSFRDTTKSVEDLFKTLSSSLQKLSGSEGLGRFISAGKLSLLSFLGDFQQTRDELFENRSQCVNKTTRCLLDLIDLFEDVSQTSEKLTTTVAKIMTTLEEFHTYCDVESDINETESPGESSALDAQLKEIRALDLHMKKALIDFQSSGITCCGMTTAALDQLGAANKSALHQVDQAQFEFDIQRRKVQVKGAELERLHSVNTDHQTARARFAEFNMECENAKLQKVSDDYFTVVQEALSTTNFALEQACMTTWATANIFFSQLSALLAELGGRAGSAADIYITVKNSLRVSKQISLEKKAFLSQRAVEASSANLSASVPEPDLFVPNDTSAHALNAKTAIRGVDLDDLFR